MAQPDERSPEPQPAEDSSPVTGAPLWFKVFAAIAIAVLLLFVIGLVTGKGDHGPGRHGGGGNDEPPASVTDHTPPSGGHTP